MLTAKLGQFCTIKYSSVSPLIVVIISQYSQISYLCVIHLKLIYVNYSSIKEDNTSPSDPPKMLDKNHNFYNTLQWLTRVLTQVHGPYTEHKVLHGQALVNLYSLHLILCASTIYSEYVIFATYCHYFQHISLSAWIALQLFGKFIAVFQNQIQLSSFSLGFLLTLTLLK